MGGGPWDVRGERGGITAASVQDSPQSLRMTGRMKRAKAETTGPGRWAAALGFALAVSASPALAQSAHTLRDALFNSRGVEGRRPPPPPVGRYVSESGQSFIFDRATAQPLLRFEDSAEVWVLSPQPAPRGDVIYKNEMGDMVLRATKLGGMTLFTGDRPGGAAAALAGQAASLQPPSVISIGALYRRLQQAADRASRAAQHIVGIETIQDARPETSVMVADSATVAAEAFERMARKGDRSRLARITRILLAEGRKPGAMVKGDALTVTYAPGQGVAGRPSSERISKVVSR
jgi:hypothetical protein